MKEISLEVRKPCSEKWDDFAPTSMGGYCNTCNKEVVDFTKLSDEEILNFFTSKPQHACGRFRPHQLKLYSTTTSPVVKPGIALVKAGLISLILIIVSKPASAQTTIEKEKVEIVQSNVLEDRVISAADSVTIRGIVVSEDDDSPLPGVNVVLKGTTIGIATDQDGRFEFPVKLKLDDVLVFSFIGLATREYKVQKLEKDKSEIKLIMLLLDITGEVSINEPYVEPSAFHKFWTKVKRVF